MATPFDQISLRTDLPTYNDGTYEGRSVTMCFHDDTVIDSTDPNTIGEFSIWPEDPGAQHPTGIVIAVEQNPDTSPDGRTHLHTCGSIAPSQ